MEKIITYENLRRFAYSNDKLIQGEIKGIVLQFSGLGHTIINNTDPTHAVEYAEHGILYIIPYGNPWSWMNRQMVDYTDEIVDVLRKKYGLDDSVKVVSTGYSMGGLCAFVYCVYAKITPCACVTNCPVCDLVYHYGEREDLPRTLYSAFWTYDGTLEEALRSCSPIHLIDRFPDIPYTVFHCDADQLVNLDMHSKRFVEVMKTKHRIDLNIVPDRKHIDLSPEAWELYYNAIEREF